MILDGLLPVRSRQLRPLLCVLPGRRGMRRHSPCHDYSLIDGLGAAQVVRWAGDWMREAGLRVPCFDANAKMLGDGECGKLQ